MECYKRKILKGFGWTSLTIVLASLIIAISSCSKKELLEPSLETVIENFEDETLLDEVIAISDEKSETEASIENINKLEQRIKLIEEIEKLRLKESEDTSEVLKQQYESLSEEEITLLIGVLKGKDAKPVELKRIEAGLVYIANEYKNWVRETGTEIAEDLMKKACKQAACEISGMEPEYYNEWKIGVVDADNFTNDIECVDPKSKKSIRYELKDIYLFASNTLCNIQGLDAKDDYKTVNKYCVEALNYAKLICASGAELKEDWFSDILKPQKREDKAKEKVIALTK